MNSKVPLMDSMWMQGDKQKDVNLCSRFGSLLPATLKGMHQWWSGIASLSLVILGGTEFSRENRGGQWTKRTERKQDKANEQTRTQTIEA